MVHMALEPPVTTKQGLIVTLPSTAQEHLCSIPKLLEQKELVENRQFTVAVVRLASVYGTPTFPWDLCCPHTNQTRRTTPCPNPTSPLQRRSVLVNPVRVHDFKFVTTYVLLESRTPESCHPHLALIMSYPNGYISYELHLLTRSHPVSLPSGQCHHSLDKLAQASHTPEKQSATVAWPNRKATMASVPLLNCS